MWHFDPVRRLGSIHQRLWGRRPGGILFFMPLPWGLQGIWPTGRSAFKPQANSRSPFLCYRNAMQSAVTAPAVGTFLFMQNLEVGFPTLNQGKIQCSPGGTKCSAVVQRLKFCESVSSWYGKKEVTLCFQSLAGTLAPCVPLQGTIAFRLSKRTLINCFGYSQNPVGSRWSWERSTGHQWRVCLQAHLRIVPSWKDMPTFKDTWADWEREFARFCSIAFLILFF